MSTHRMHSRFKCVKLFAIIFLYTECGAVGYEVCVARPEFVLSFYYLGLPRQPMKWQGGDEESLQEPLDQVMSYENSAQA